VDKIKLWVRDFLINLAKSFDSEKKGPVIRNTKRFLAAEIKVPIVLSVLLTFIITYFLIAAGMPYSYANLLSVGILTLVIAYVFIFETRKEPSIASDNDAVVLTCLNLIIAIVLINVFRHYSSVLVFPISAFVIMGVMLLCPRLGLIYAVILSLIAAFLSGMRFDIFVIMLGGGAAVLTKAKKIRNRWDFVIAAVITTGVNVVIITMFYLLKFYPFWQYQRNMYYGLLNGLLVLTILLVIMPIFERLFSRTTNIKLIELADFNNPLLKTLMLKAPGTYHHSLQTATIAEQAAQAIGENPILARVISYYHDIGKLKNPEYFIENQGGGHNPHDDLTTTMSTLILISHIKDGVALAKKYNIDNDIIDCIVSHHGTTVMSYFFNKASQGQDEDDIDLNENDCRYPGPKPQSKMAAILMLADSCEAASRAIDEPTSSKISEMVNRIVAAKIEDEQFCECPITFKELELIKENITSVLLRMHHSRIKYEENDEKKDS
jgi:putative nucleotidyltransferase with HDIG domain